MCVFYTGRFKRHVAWLVAARANKRKMVRNEKIPKYSSRCDFYRLLNNTCGRGIFYMKTNQTKLFIFLIIFNIAVIEESICNLLNKSIYLYSYTLVKPESVQLYEYA